jgi:hypothetical protein
MTKDTKSSAPTQDVRIRRAPKYLPFLLLGGVIGFIVALIIGFSIPADQLTAQPIQGYLVVFLTGIGVGLGIVTALIIDRISSARAKVATATKLKG